MKSIILTIALLVSTISFAQLGQRLSENSLRLKKLAPYEFKLIETVLKEQCKDGNEFCRDFYLIMVNAQTAAYWEYLDRDRSTSAERQRISKAVKESTWVIDGMLCTDFVKIKKILDGGYFK